MTKFAYSSFFYLGLNPAAAVVPLLLVEDEANAFSEANNYF